MKSKITKDSCSATQDIWGFYFIIRWHSKSASTHRIFQDRLDSFNFISCFPVFFLFSLFFFLFRSRSYSLVILPDSLARDQEMMLMRDRKCREISNCADTENEVIIHRCYSLPPTITYSFFPTSFFKGITELGSNSKRPNSTRYWALGRKRLKY